MLPLRTPTPLLQCRASGGDPRPGGGGCARMKGCLVAEASGYARPMGGHQDDEAAIRA
jgi:hypothetical protein